MHAFVRCSALAAGLLMVMTVSVAEAQQRTRTSEGLLMLGGSRLDVAELNTRLDAFGYPTFDDQFLQVGYVRSWGGGPVRLGFELAGVSRPAQTTANNQYRTRLAGGYGMLNIGYDVYDDGRVSVVPKVGVGAGGINLAITDRAAPSFDEVLVQPGRSVTLNTGSLLLDGSLGLRYRVAPRATRRGQRSLMLGARVGYTQSVLHGEWRREESDAPGGPTAGWGGPHFEFMIGRSLRR